MPEGDTIHHAARRLRAALVGRSIVSIEALQERHRHDGWPARLAARAVREVEAQGKHRFVRFDGDALLDQRNLAGTANIWKSESCHLEASARGGPCGRQGDDNRATFWCPACQA